MKKNPYTTGFTLVELLISIFVAMMIMLAVGYVTTSTSTSSLYLNTNSNLLKEGQIAQQLISGRLSEAIYVFPAGSSTLIQFGTTGDTTRNTVDTTLSSASEHQWIFGNTVDASGNTVVGNGVNYYDASGTTPQKSLFVAMILPPEATPTYDSSGNSTNCTGTGSTSTDITSGCYRFFAYYPMRRSKLVSSSMAQSSKPMADSQNDFPNDPAKDRWVLMEYRANLYNKGQSPAAWVPGYTKPSDGVQAAVMGPSTLPSYYQGNKANVLVDYVKPGSVTFTVYRPGAPNATTGVSDPTALTTANGRVDYTFQMERFMSGKTIVATPVNDSAGQPQNLGGSATPKNWYCPKAMVVSPFALNCP